MSVQYRYDACMCVVMSLYRNIILVAILSYCQ